MWMIKITYNGGHSFLNHAYGLFETRSAARNVIAGRLERGTACKSIKPVKVKATYTEIK